MRATGVPFKLHLRVLRGCIVPLFGRVCFFYHEGHEDHEGRQRTERLVPSLGCMALTLQDVKIFSFNLRALRVLRGCDLPVSGRRCVFLPRRARRTRRNSEERTFGAVSQLYGVDVERRSDLHTP